MNYLKRNNGVSLVTLVITIIVLLILSVITINVALNKEHGLINKSKKVSESNEIEEEKELIELVVAKALKNSYYGRIGISELQSALELYVGDKDISVNSIDEDNQFEFTFNESGRKYNINDKGELIDN